MKKFPAKYAAKALFQFRFEGEPDICFRETEERIFLVEEKGAKLAFDAAVRRCIDAQFSAVNDAKVKFFFEFVGIVELMHLGDEAGDSVWYEIRKMKNPMERRAALTKGLAETSAAEYERVRLTGLGSRPDRP